MVQLFFAAAQSADFLASSRGGGTGFSFFVLGDDPSGALYNPASLGFINGWQSQIMYNKRNNYAYIEPKEDPYYGLLGVVYYKPEWGAFSLNGVQSGSFFSDTDIPTVNYFAISFGREFWPGLALGASVKYLDEYGFLERSAFDIDFGVTYRTFENIILAASAENIARSKLTPVYFGISERLPRRGRVGGAYIYETDQFQAAFLLASQIQESGILQNQTTFLANIGTEWWFNRFGKLAFGTRMGYTLGKDVLNDIKSDYESLSGGFSINYELGTSNLRLDYSVETYPFETADGSTPLNHYIAFNFGWGGVPSYHRYESEEEYTEKPPLQTHNRPSPEFETNESTQMQDNMIDRDTNFDTGKYERYDVDMNVADISSMDAKRIVFYLRPQTIINTNLWKLYIFKAKIKKWDEEEIDRWALKVIQGKGLPPINVIWGGVSRDGKLLPPGKYYYILTAVDLQGQQFATKWHNFILE